MTTEERGGKIERIGRGTLSKGLYNIMSSTQLESEYGTCPDCGRENIEFKRWSLGDGSIKKIGNCPDCQKKVEKQLEQQKEVERGLAIAKKRREWRESCNIPPKFMKEQFDTFEQGRQQQAYDKCYEYADNFPRTNSRGYHSLVLFSYKSWGTGKTHLTCSIAHHIINRWDREETSYPVYCISEYDIFASIQETFNYSIEEKYCRESEADIIRRLISVPLLIIDDVGKEKRSDKKPDAKFFVQRTLFKIIDGRYKAERPIVITANLSPTQLKNYLGAGGVDDASFDRLWEMTKGEFFNMEGESYRRR